MLTYFGLIVLNFEVFVLIVEEPHPTTKRKNRDNAPSLKDGAHYGVNQPCFCLCLGFSQMTITRPLRLMILHFSQIGLTEGLTFMILPP